MFLGVMCLGQPASADDAYIKFTELRKATKITIPSEIQGLAGLATSVKSLSENI